MNSTTFSMSSPWGRHRWISITVVVVGLVVAVLAGLRLGGDLPALPPITPSAQQTQKHPFDALLLRPAIARQDAEPSMMNESNPFYTDFFKPPPQPSPAPPPPKPTMKEVEVLFQGWFESSSKEVEAFVSVGGERQIGSVDSALGDDLLLLEIHPDYIRVQSQDEKEHEIPFNKVVKLNIPLQ